MGTPMDARAATAVAVARSLGLDAREAVVLHDSNKLAVRLLPCDVLARVAPVDEQVSQFEVDLARRLAAAGGPVAALDPRVPPEVFESDGFTVTFWTYYEPVAAEVAPAEFAAALERLHAAMRAVDLPSPHFTDRVAEALAIVTDPEASPELPEPERALLTGTLRDLRDAVGERGREQLLHGESHPGNLIAAEHGPVFIDFETCCRGPVEFDLAHAPDRIAEHYDGVDESLLADCRILMLALIIAWRWDKRDRLPDGRRLGAEWLAQMREALARRDAR